MKVAIVEKTKKKKKLTLCDIAVTANVPPLENINIQYLVCNIYSMWVTTDTLTRTNSM